MGCVYSRACIGDVCTPRDRFKGNENAREAEIGVFSPASSDGEEGEIRDQLNALSGTRDSEVGITRLSRVSGQFLPPDGSRTIKVPSGNYELRYSFLSQRGYYPDALDKANQDSFCIHTPFGTNPDDHFFGVFDGHGEFGAQCSQFVKRKLCENLLRNSRFHMDAVEACHAAFLTTNSQLHADTLDDSMSGTTSITILVRGRTLYIANSGDSRAVIAERRGKDIVAVDLSIDQTPFRSDELERVKRCGARVLTLDQIEGLKNPDVQCWGTEEGDDGDPPRLWVQNGMYPGTAFTRSIGDSVAETIGVVANPEIVVLELSPGHPFFVLASDGVFEFLSSQMVIDMVAKHKDPRDACAAIVAESYRLWLQYETRTDDITVIVVHINGLTDTTVDQSTSPGALLRPPLPQVVEVTGSESPSTISWNSRNQRARHDLSRARLRAIESSLEKGQIWVAPSSGHRKTWEEEAHIERALHDHFLFRKLTDSQCHVLLDCMQRVEVQPGDIVVKQGGEGDCFYVVGSGEFEVFATQEEKNGEVPRVLQRYTAEKLSSFGELALMYNKPLQASVRAVTNGTLWALKREDFRGILMSEFSNLSSLKVLRSVDLLSRLTILQLSHIADSLSEVSFSDGQTIIEQNETLMGLYIIQKGQVRITFNEEVVNSHNVCSLVPDSEKQDDDMQNNKELSVEKAEGSYFGEWRLLGEHISSLNAVAVGDVVCAVLTKEKFDSVVGPLAKLSQDDHKSRDYSLSSLEKSIKSIDPSTLAKIKLSDLEWRKCFYSTDCSEVGLVLLRDSENFLSLKRFSKQNIKRLGKEAQVLKEKKLMKSLSPSASVPQVLCTCADQTHAGILLNTSLACPVASILHLPLDEPSARFCAASVVSALEDLHKNGVLYRGVSPDVLMFDQTGHIQLVDFRFGKELCGERTFTICGMADSLSPEIIQGKGHGLPADWWALGVLIYFMLQGEMPFGSWRESELDTFAKIVRGQLTLPETFSPEAVDLITKFLEVDESTRLGSQGADSVKSHPWFHGIDWKRIADGSFPVPHEIISRITQHLENHSDDLTATLLSPPRDLEELNTPEWLEDW
ncbi:protein phosphatase 2C and cyclic nucleotide-binding/kinase domain-containing protein [Cornus florida]|uniref:protein phosphatase 2C and cyclic nucleotide-binding/kinase domain-containing protein n=1 Tax=Cornus florida TaxID=4283 RepID=UPI002896D9D0|nr:protein phosphatase 2C and cyclic nucleotide-binding/kinase domain-containing protein [Cornus florida]XP_059634931.1 protein phosphatase 2C and cyclic nucleotide-binding/kinase domain-containing protein [Cornus florida]XP_059634932.1 protein phosphatase 2C and cyclic nucleotide-binding/kinase domain-containing protein [Cornus florida]XP_059634933.1 protein phosphatase 2C and cyclic nucleotide-binding/kinase domain-containing protein [Cornus florida]XP_059634934.1 protein phosphatase 2C and c